MQKTIKSGASYLTIDTLGGKIVELVIDGAKILGSFQRIDGKTGSTHICTPNFAGEGMAEFGLPFHGPARNMEWQVVNESENTIEISVILEALEKYKSPLEVRQIFHLLKVDPIANRSRMTNGGHSEASVGEPWNPNQKVMLSSPKHPEEMFFHHEVSVKNIGNHAVPVNIGIHNYFYTPNGWQEAKLNGKNIKEEIENNLSVPVIARRTNDEAISDTSSRHPGYVQDQTTDSSDSGVARVYGEFAEPLPRMTNIPNTNNPVTWNLELGTRNVFRIATQGASEMVTWTGVKEGKYDDKYVCIEPVCWFDTKFFGTPPSLLMPGETRVLTQKISVL